MPLSTQMKKILYVAYPLLPVRADSCGGAEQILLTLEREAVRSGLQTTVASCSGSEVQGSVYPTGAPASGNLASARDLEAHHCAQTVELISVRRAIGRGFDVVHDHSGSFFSHGESVDVPVIATLHLPRSFYPEHWFARVPENVHFICVSKAQARTFAGIRNLRGVVPNGIQLEQFALQATKDDFLLWMGRICEEKAPHIALDIAAQHGLRIVIAGKVYPFAYHQQYFQREVLPRIQRMGTQVKFVECPALRQKIELLRFARAVLITSQVDETSSLVAMEAAACGTPVIAFRRGALPEIVKHGETGWLMRDEQQMGEAIRRVREIRPRTCREHALRNFPAERMFSGYLARYKEVMAARDRVPMAA
jgi:glycosyltransferase involved in cell wall biosynthesis